MGKENFVLKSVMENGNLKILSEKKQQVGKVENIKIIKDIFLFINAIILFVVRKDILWNIAL